MLARRKKPRFKESPRTDFPRHRAWVRKHVCAVTGCQNDSIECAHVRAGLPRAVPSWARPGTSKKSHDAFTLPLCSEHHKQQHWVGEPNFQIVHKVNMLNVALDLARHSPCPEIKQFIKELGL